MNKTIIVQALLQDEELSSDAFRFGIHLMEMLENDDAEGFISVLKSLKIKKSRSEINHDYYMNRTKKMNSDQIQTNSDQSKTELRPKKSEKSLNQSENDKEKREEKEESFSPSFTSSLSSSPSDSPNNNPITPIIPSSKEEKGEKKELASAVAEPLFPVKEKSLDLAKTEDSKQKKAQNVPISALIRRKKADEKPKLHPEDDAFWDTFKEHKPMALAFYQASGLFPVKSQFGKWKNDFRNFDEAGIDTDTMLRAYEKLSGEVTVSSPGSLLNTAISLKHQKIVPKTLKSQTIPANMTPEEVMSNGNMFKSAADMLRALNISKQNQTQKASSEVIDL